MACEARCAAAQRRCLPGAARTERLAFPGSRGATGAGACTTGACHEFRCPRALPLAAGVCGRRVHGRRRHCQPNASERWVLLAPFLAPLLFVAACQPGGGCTALWGAAKAHAGKDLSAVCQPLVRCRRAEEGAAGGGRCAGMKTGLAWVGAWDCLRRTGSSFSVLQRSDGRTLAPICHESYCPSWLV